MLSVEEYGLEHYIPLHCQEEYKKVAFCDLPIEERIVQLLTINPGFMEKISSLTDEETYKNLRHNDAIKLIKKLVLNKKIIKIYALSFNVKPQIRDISNGLIYPDAADFITLLHLNLIFKYINEIYPLGAELKVGTQFNYFRKLHKISQEEAIKMHDMVVRFNAIAEKFVKVSGYVVIYDIYKEIEPYKKDFFLKVENAKFKILQEDLDMKELKKSTDYYLNFVVDVDQFPNREAAWNFCMYHTLDSAAYKYAITNMYDTSNGFFKDYSQYIPGETRFQSGSNLKEIQNSIYIAFLPGTATFSFNRLTLKKLNGNWELVTYKEIKKMNAKEVYVRGRLHPFYFLETQNG